MPGIGATTAGATDWTDTASNLYTAQSVVSAGSVAVVAWLGYTTPPIPSASDPDLSVLDNSYAEAGATRLNAALAGLAAVRHDGVTLNVVAHSYGTTTASLALAAADEHVHSFVMLGSAGIPGAITDAEALHADHVYAGQASDLFPWTHEVNGDNLAWIGRDLSLRQDPMAPSFDATTFGTAGAAGPDGSEHGAAVTTHNVDVAHPGADGYGYLDPGSESLYNVTQATTTGADLAPYVWGDYTHLTLDDLLTNFKTEVLRQGLQSAIADYQRHGIPAAVITSLETLAGYTAIPTP